MHFFQLYPCVMDYHKPKSGALGYRPSQDKYLAKYFSSPVIVQHLRKIGLINENGNFVADADLKRVENIEKRKNVDLTMASRDQWLKRRDFQLGRQVGLEKHLQAVQKVLSYRKVKGSENYQRQPIDPRELEHCLTRSNSLPLLSENHLSRQYNEAYHEYKNLHKYDTQSLQNFCSYLTAQLEVIHAKTLSIDNDSTPPIILKLKKPKSRPLVQKWRWKYFQDTLLPPKLNSEPTVSRNSSENSGFRIRIPKLQTCQCFIMYVKPSENQVKMTIQQQHSGGNTITVFKDWIIPNEKIAFGSYRKMGQTFAIVISVNDQVLLRLSTCCESKYKPFSRLGGKSSPIKWLGTENALLCYKCGLNNSRRVDDTKFTPSLPRVVKNEAQDTNGSKSSPKSQSRQNLQNVDDELKSHSSISEYSYSDEDSQNSIDDNEKSHISRNDQSVPSSSSSTTKKRPTMSEVRKVFSYDPWICNLCKFDNFYDDDCCRICGASRD